MLNYDFIMTSFEEVDRMFESNKLKIKIIFFFWI